MRSGFSFGLALAILSTILLGCASSPPGPKLTQETSFGTKLSPETVAKIKEGTSTREEVRELFGSPSTLTLMGDGKEMWFYQYMLTRTPVTQTVVLDPETGPRVVNRRNPEMVMQMTQVLFSKEGIVERITHSTSGSTIKSEVVAE